jgi:hypothetical protein
MRRVLTLLAVGAAAVLIPTLASAQASISGTVTDTSGAVMPGVTVEVASPALIEQSRTTVTDGAGNYRITSLRPGTYSVTFTLEGFSVIKRDGIILQGTFDAPVNAELRVGALQETVTVSGAAPVVDVRNNITQTVLTKEQIEILPGARTLKGRAALIPGVVIPGANTGAVAHGSDSQDSHTMVDGFKSGQHLVGRGTGQLGVGSVTQTQEATIEELVYSTDSQGAEYAFSGVRMNMIPKEGSNRTTIEGIAYGSNQHFERNNLGSLQTGPNPFRYVPQLFFFDFNPVIGGPIRENKLWYFGSVAGNRSNTQILDIFFKPDEPSTPESCRNRPANDLCPAYTGAKLNLSQTVRITHQASSKHKLRYSFDNTKLDNLYGNYITSGAKASPEAAWNLPLWPTWLAQVKYTAPITSRLLIEAGYAYQRGDFRVLFQPANGPTDVAHWDLGLGLIEENGYINYKNTEKKQEAKASISYVTGSHSFKFGGENRWASALQTNPYNGDVQILFTFNRVPLLAQVTNGPSTNVQRIYADGGAYAQDQWRVGRFTINLGVRWDHFHAGIPAQTNPGGFFASAVSIEEIKRTPYWNDWATRTGVAWDVFGNGKTAIKAFAGRFVAGHALSRTSQFNPIFSQSDLRSWTDLNGDGTALSLVNGRATPQFNEIGPANNALFGTLAGIDRLDPNLHRDKNWTYEVTGSHELFPRVSVGGGFYKRHYYDLAWTDNLAVGGVDSGDWIPFTFRGPADTRLVNGGNEAITLYNLVPSKVGVKNNLLTNSNDYRDYNGFEATTNIRLPRNAFAFSSITAGKTHTYACTGGGLGFGNFGAGQDNPNNLRFCDQSTPFRYIFKLSGGVPLAWGVMVSGNFQIFDAPGSGLFLVPPYFAAQLVVNAANAGRAITGGQTTINQINVNLLEPNLIYQQYYKIVDTRITKTMMVGRLRTTVLAEFENLFNIRSINAVTQNYGANWLRPATVQRGLNVRFGLQMRF